jgi:glucose-6-phosphate 1-dehydrogenase
LNRIVQAHFQEDQVFRIDHYLGKETVQNILVFRFANTLFEPVWNANYVDHVQITVAESVLVGSRAAYYDQSGVLRDMFQNHLLQLLALVAMEAPARYAAGPLRREKQKVFDAVEPPTLDEACSQVVTGQYEGYLKEKDVPADSKTPTYAAVRMHIDNWRWKGVPFYLRSGKGLAGRYSEVLIQFRCPPHLMFPLPPGATLQCNRLSMCIQPDEGIHLNFQTKVPDSHMAMRPADMEFHYRSSYAGVVIPEAYERLLQDAMNGDAALFMHSEEIERAWQIMDPLIAATERPDAPSPEPYPVGSMGPKCAAEMLGREGRSWMTLCQH